jgi:hypothetical protein
MARLPTAKSRLVAYIGIAFVAAAEVIVGWFSSSVPILAPVLIGAIAVGAMLWAKQIREQDGVEARQPTPIKSSLQWLGNIEATFAALSGISVTVVLILTFVIPSTRAALQFAIFVSLGVMSANALTNIYTGQRYFHILRNYDESEKTNVS